MMGFLNAALVEYAPPLASEIDRDSRSGTALTLMRSIRV